MASMADNLIDIMISPTGVPGGIGSGSTTTTAAVGAAVGSVIPGVGIAIGSIVGSLLGLLGIGSKTQKLTWDETNSIAGPKAHEIALSLQSQTTASDFAQIAIRFPNAYRQFVANSDWWEQSTRKIYYDGYDKNIMPQTTDLARVEATFWLALMWICGNVPRDRLTEAQDRLTNFLGYTLGAIMKDLGIEKPFVPIPTPTTVPPPVVTPPSSKKQDFTIYIVAGVAVVAGVIALLWFRKE